MNQRPEKTAQHQLVRALQDRLATYEVQNMLDLLELLTIEARETLVTCALADVPRVQGEARAYDKLLKLLRRPAPLPTALV